MITKLPRVAVQQPAGSGREVWVIPAFWLIGMKAHIGVGQRLMAYKPREGDFMGGDLDSGDIAALRSVTIIAPGGSVLVHNGMLGEPTTWEGSLKPVCNGVFIKAVTEFEAVTPSVMHCFSPPGNGRRFEGKELRREFIPTGETYTFLPGDIGFGVVYGADEMCGFSVVAGDVFTATQDTVLAVVSEADYEANP